jgi:hypothetical protein
VRPVDGVDQLRSSAGSQRGGRGMWRVMATLCIHVALLGCRAAPRSVPQVLSVDWERADDDTYTFRVTLQHDDTGWDHYADWWVVQDLDGEELARRVLRHPHVEEQPFTRGIEGVRLPPGAEAISLRGHCSRHGYGPPYQVSLGAG